MMSLEIWDKLKAPPKDALSKITGGRLSGKTDIKPQWRYEVMTEVFGECGVGWKYEILKLWTESAPAEQIFAFAQVNLYVVINKTWSDAIPGIGGSMLIEQETKGLHANDEAFKMAVTDALSVAMKMLGVGADIYRGYWDGSKYSRPVEGDKRSALEIWEEEFAKKGFKREALTLLLALKAPGINPEFTLQNELVKRGLQAFLGGKAGTLSKIYLDYVNKLEPESAQAVMQSIEKAGIVFQGKDMNYDFPEKLATLTQLYQEAC
jgi:hypothetical protein